jgi:hypothetical protein
MMLLVGSLIVAYSFDNRYDNLPIEGAVRIELEEGVPILRASNVVLARIEQLLAKQQNIASNEIPQSL